MTVRRADFAGSWYPGSVSDCRQAIEELDQSALPCPSSSGKKVGGIVPHAGWYYSGRIACSVIKCLANESEPDTIIIFGRHLHTGSNNYLMKEGEWATPLGDLEIDCELGNRLASEFSFTLETPSRYEQDNTIELQLPFLKYFFHNVKILPIGVRPSVDSIRIGEKVAEISELLGRKILILGSTDLTHYGANYGFTPKGVGDKAVEWVKNENDKKVVDLMLQMDPEGVIRESMNNQNACCSGAVATTIAAVKKMGARKGEKLIHLTSYDVRPDDSFVGYVGVVFS